MRSILLAKFTTVEMASTVLLATRDAELWHGARGLPKSRQVILEDIRKTLAQSKFESGVADATNCDAGALTDSANASSSSKKRKR